MSREPDHAHFRGGLSSNLTTLASTVPEISLGAAKFIN